MADEEEKREIDSFVADEDVAARSNAMVEENDDQKDINERSGEDSIYESDQEIPILESLSESEEGTQAETKIKERPMRCIMCLVLGVLVAIGIGILTGYLLTRLKSSSGGQETDASTISPSLAPTFIAEELFDAAVGLSGREALSKPDSPQFQAIGWMSTLDQIETGGVEKNFAQRYAVVTVYYSFRGGNWVHQEEWMNPTKHECAWSRGITCRRDVTESLVITGFDVTNNNLQGEIAPEIGLLNYVERLSLRRNRIGGVIPTTIGTMSALKGLDLSFNFIAGSIPIAIPKNLDSLDLSNNQINSSIPEELFNLKFLRTLVLSSNELTGPLPDAVNNLERLTKLDLRNNLLNGPVPSLWNGTPELDFIYLDYNQFSGTLPPITNVFATKQVISLSHNTFEGNIEISPTYVLRPTNVRLQNMDVSYNLLTGELSPILGSLHTLRHMDLSENAFIGTFPSSSNGWANLVFLAASNNAMTGTFPSGLNTLSKY